VSNSKSVVENYKTQLAILERQSTDQAKEVGFSYQEEDLVARSG